MKTIIYNSGIYSSLVAQVRCQKGFHQLVVAERIRISRSTLSKIENNEMVPSVITAMKLAAFFEVSVERLFEIYELKPEMED